MLFLVQKAILQALKFQWLQRQRQQLNTKKSRKKAPFRGFNAYEKE